MSPNASNSPVVASPASLPHLQIVDRLVDQFPLVNTALDYANQRYAQLKSSSKLVNDTLDRAEKSIQAVVTTTVVPVLNQLEQPIHYADNKAVAGFELVQAKFGTLEKSATDLKATSLKVLDQTKERIAQVKTSTLSKVHSVLTLPTNVVPLLDQILNAGENVLDYLLPEDPATKQQNGTKDGSKKVPEEVPKDTRAVLRLVFVHVRAFTEKVQRRVVDYSRDRWIPALFARIVLIKGNLSDLANSAVASKLLPLVIANGHSNNTQEGASTSAATPNSTPKKATSNNTSSSNTSSPSSSSPNGDVKLTEKSTQSASQS